MNAFGVPIYVSKAPSMKVPPKRKGNFFLFWFSGGRGTLNESPSEKEGKSPHQKPPGMLRSPSMKVPPKRKGNLHCELLPAA